MNCANSTPITRQREKEKQKSKSKTQTKKTKLIEIARTALIIAQ
jgi:hypothetical protein